MAVIFLPFEYEGFYHLNTIQVCPPLFPFIILGQVILILSRSISMSIQVITMHALLLLSYLFPYCKQRDLLGNANKIRASIWFQNKGQKPLPDLSTSTSYLVSCSSQVPLLQKYRFVVVVFCSLN